MKAPVAGIAALAEVVRTVFSDVEARGLRVADDARAALALVDHWIAGEPVDGAALGAAASRAHQDGVPLANREKDRALSWANTAAGNLAYAAQKGRASKESERATMDAAEYALSSLGGQDAKDRKALERIRAAAARAAEKGAAAPKKTAKATKATKASTPTEARPARLGDELDGAIGVVAAARLRTRKATLRAAERVGDTALRKYLASREYPAHASVLAFDARYGGLHVPDEEDTEWTIGAYACLSSDAHTAPRGAPGLRGDAALVPVIYSPNDVVYFLDGHGTAWAHDTIEGGFDRFAEDADRLVARVILYDVLFERADEALVETAAKRGEEAAAALSLPAIPEASDDLVRVWGDAHALVFEERTAEDASRNRGPWTTRVCAHKAKTLAPWKARLDA